MSILHFRFHRQSLAHAHQPQRCMLTDVRHAIMLQKTNKTAKTDLRGGTTMVRSISFLFSRCVLYFRVGMCNLNPLVTVLDAPPSCAETIIDSDIRGDVVVRPEAHPGSPAVRERSRSGVRAGHNSRVPADEPRGADNQEPRVCEGRLRASSQRPPDHAIFREVRLHTSGRSYQIFRDRYIPTAIRFHYMSRTHRTDQTPPS